MRDKNSKLYERLFGSDYHFIWSDNWWVEDHLVWFVAGAINILFCIDREKGTVILAEKIPSDEIIDLRLHPRCLKQGESIFCLPDRGEDIWRFCRKEHIWQRIPLNNPQKVRIRCSNAWSVKGSIYIVAIGLGQILELNADTNHIERCHDLVQGNEGSIAGSILVEDNIYVVGKGPARIYKFSCQNKTIQTYSLTEIQDDLETICHDGERFWLSGQKQNMYLWREGKDIFALEDFPEDFGIYNFSGKYRKLLNHGDNKSGAPLFNAAVSADRYVWFIPFHANEILYVDKETLKIKKFFLEKEEQTKEEMENQLLRHKYLLQYVKDNRYIGLFSLKNKWVWEIDCHDLTYKILDYVVDTDIRDQIDTYVLMNYFGQSKNRFEDTEHGLESLIRYCLLTKGSEAAPAPGERSRLTMGQNVYAYTMKSELK